MCASAEKIPLESKGYPPEPRTKPEAGQREANPGGMLCQTLTERVIYFMNSYNEN